MSMKQRVSALEQNQKKNEFHMAVFSWASSGDEAEDRKKQKALVEEYIAQGNPRPTLTVLMNEIPRKIEPRKPEIE